MIRHIVFVLGLAGLLAGAYLKKQSIEWFYLPMAVGAALMIYHWYTRKRHGA
jgi:hypothetical protein